MAATQQELGSTDRYGNQNVCGLNLEPMMRFNMIPNDSYIRNSIGIEIFETIPSWNRFSMPNPTADHSSCSFIKGYGLICILCVENCCIHVLIGSPDIESLLTICPLHSVFIAHDFSAGNQQTWPL